MLPALLVSFSTGLLAGVGLGWWFIAHHLPGRIAAAAELSAARLEILEENLSARFSAFEVQVAQHLHAAKHEGLRIFAGPHVTRIVPAAPAVDQATTESGTQELTNEPNPSSVSDS